MYPVIAAGAMSRRRRLERQVVEAFETAGATEPNTSKTLQEMNLDDDGTFRRVADAGLVRETSPGRWYLDSSALSDYREAEQRRNLLGIVIGLLVLGFALFMALTRR